MTVNVTMLTPSVTAGEGMVNDEEMVNDAACGAGREIFVWGVTFVWAESIFSGMESYGVCKATNGFYCTTTLDGASETVFVFLDCGILMMRRIGIVNVKQRTWTCYACALSYHVVALNLSQLSETLTLNESWNVLS